MLEKAPQECEHRQRRRRITARTKGDAGGCDAQDAGVADGDPVRVATEAAVDLLGTAEGALGVDDPARAMEGVGAPTCSASLVFGSEHKPAFAASTSEPVEHLAAKECGQDVHREQKLAGGGDPAIAVRGEPAAGDDAVHVWMKDELAGPGVQHGRDPELSLRAEPLRIPATVRTSWRPRRFASLLRGRLARQPLRLRQPPGVFWQYAGYTEGTPAA